MWGCAGRRASDYTRPRLSTPPRCRTTRGAASRGTRPRHARLTFRSELHALARAEADHRRRADRAGCAVRPVLLVYTDVELLSRGAGRVRAEVLQKGLDL